MFSPHVSILTEAMLASKNSWMRTALPRLSMGHVMNHHPTTHFPGQKWRNTVQSATGLQPALPFLMNINGSFILDFKECDWAQHTTQLSNLSKWENNFITRHSTGLAAEPAHKLLSHTGVAAKPQTLQQWPHRSVKKQNNNTKQTRRKEGKANDAKCPNPWSAAEGSNLSFLWD